MEPLVIYHASCADGFCAAWLMHHAYPKAEFHAANYQQDPVEFEEGREVFIVDFSYPRDVMIAMNEKASKLVVLDHHKTAEEACEGLDFCTFDMNKSGAMLTWDYLKANVPHHYPDSLKKVPFDRDFTPAIVDYVQDRDLYTWKLPDSKEYNSALRSYPFEFEVWDKLSSTAAHLLIKDGRAIERYRQQVIDQHVSHASEFVIDGHKVLGVCCTAIDMHSEVAGALAMKEGYPFGFVYLDTVGYRKFSLRSRDDFDVSAIAKKFGGGGHQRAAGFAVRHGSGLSTLGCIIPP